MHGLLTDSFLSWVAWFDVVEWCVVAMRNSTYAEGIAAISKVVEIGHACIKPRFQEVKHLERRAGRDRRLHKEG